MSIDDERPSAGGPLVVCSVCGRVLSYDEAERRYAHNLQDQVNEDHPPIPAQAKDLPTHNARCDFCNIDVSHSDVWTVPASDFELPRIMGITVGGGVESARPQMSIGDWAACLDCVRLIQRDRWSQLIKRVQETAPSGTPSNVQKAWLVGLYRKLAVHIQAEPYPAGDRLSPRLLLRRRPRYARLALDEVGPILIEIGDLGDSRGLAPSALATGAHLF